MNAVCRAKTALYMPMLMRGKDLPILY